MRFHTLFICILCQFLYSCPQNDKWHDNWTYSTLKHLICLLFYFISLSCKKKMCEQNNYKKTIYLILLFNIWILYFIVLCCNPLYIQSMVAMEIPCFHCNIITWHTICAPAHLSLKGGLFKPRKPRPLFAQLLLGLKSSVAILYQVVSPFIVVNLAFYS